MAFHPTKFLNYAMSHPGKLEGKVAIITGGGGGFGEGIVAKYTFEGAKVVVFDIDGNNAEKVAAAQTKGVAVGYGGDVSSLSAWKEVLEVALTSFGKLDIVVNNAGVTYLASSSLETPEEDFDRCIKVHLKQVFHSTRVIVPYFLENNIKGVFVNVSSISAVRPRPGMLWYGATKAGVTNATKGLAIEFGPKGIRFNVIHPVAGETAM